MGASAEEVCTTFPEVSVMALGCSISSTMVISSIESPVDASYC